MGSLFSGIGGLDLGLERSGMETVWMVETDKACREVLAKQFPGVPVFEDVRHVKGSELEPVGLICGGFPCQDLSVAGKRAGLDGGRSGLWWEFARIIDELAPAWVLIENVPGLLSSQEGAYFALIIQWLAERGYGVAWRVFDSQYFGVAQRRRRVFIVGSFGNGRCAQVLFESSCLCGDSPPRRETGTGTSGSIARSIGNVGGGNDYGANKGTLAICYENHAQDSRIREIDKPNIPAKAGTGGNNLPLIAFAQNTRDEVRVQGDGNISGALASQPGMKQTTYVTCPTLRGFGHGWQGQHNDDMAKCMMVRRLTPTECERLQGFPDGWTAQLSDTQRYRTLGNAVTVSVAEWIGRRIVEVQINLD